jgi:hypothetical protein
MFNVYRVVQEDADQLSQLLAEQGSEELTRIADESGGVVMVVRGDYTLGNPQLELRGIRARLLNLPRTNFEVDTYEVPTRSSLTSSTRITVP